MIQRLWALIAALLAAQAISGAAAAHLLPPQTATVNLVDRKAYAVVAVPVSALAGVGADRTGRLSAAALNAAKGAVAQQFQQKFRITASGRPPKETLSLVSDPQTEGSDPAPRAYVVVLYVAVFDRPPTSLTIEDGFVGRGGGADKVTLRARRGADVEVAVLSPDAPSRTVFKGPLTTLLDFIGVGVGHIWSGADHLLFLLTVVAAGVGWRYWAGIITTFTAAHSVTLTLAVLGVIRAPSALVEPAIAASIIAMALVNLARRGAAGRERYGLVLGFGLLHGLGFASGLIELGLDPKSRVASLIGFNIGVEIGQVAFVCALVLAGALLGRLIRGDGAGRLAPALSGLAAAIGSVMLVERLAPLAAGLGGLF